MSGLLGRVGRVLGVHYAENSEYRAVLLLWALASTMSFIMMGIWFGAANRGQISLQPDAVVRYFTAIYLTNQLADVWLSSRVESDLQTGRFGHHLMRPVDPMWHYMAFLLADRSVRLPASFAVCIFVFLVYPPAVPACGVATIFVVLGFCCLAFLIRFFLQYTITLISFWTGRSSAIELLLVTSMMFLCGGLVPLDELPGGIQRVLSYTPFPIMGWVPSSLLAGRPAGDLWQSVVVGGAWLVALTALNRVVWRRARRRFGEIGG